MMEPETILSLPLPDLTGRPVPAGLESTWIRFDDKRFEVFHNDRSDHIFQVLRGTHSFYEVDLLSALARYLPADAFAIDVGANIGNHALFFAGVLGCHVACFEPEPQALALLQRNIVANGLGDRATTWPYAVAGSRCRFSIEPATIAHNLGAVRLQHNETGSIEAVPLDEIDFGRPV